MFILGRTYLSIRFYNNHNCNDQKTVVILVILFECVVAILFHPGIVIVTALSDL